MDGFITFNAFSFLQPKLKARNLPYANAQLPIGEGTTPLTLMADMGLAHADVEAVFLNGRIVSKETPIGDGDRVAFVPPGGTPGPYRVMLGMKKKGDLPGT